MKVGCFLMVFEESWVKVGATAKSPKNDTKTASTLQNRGAKELLTLASKLGVFCRNLQVFKKGCRAFGSVFLTGEIDVNLYETAD